MKKLVASDRWSLNTESFILYVGLRELENNAAYDNWSLREVATLLNGSYQT